MANKFSSILILFILLSFTLKSQNTISDSISIKNKNELEQVSLTTDSLLVL